MNNTIKLDCQLADQLDSSVQNSMGISGGTSLNRGELFYNTANDNVSNAEGGDGGTKISPEMIQAGLATTTAIVSGISKNRASQGACKKPLIRETFINRGKWATYKACLDREEKAKQRELEIEQAKARAKEAEANAKYQNRSGGGSTDDGSDKILGMPKGLAIGIGVALGLAVVGFVAFKIIKAKKA